MAAVACGAAGSCVAVIPARRAEATISATLESLRLGNDTFVERVLVVTSADDPTARVVEGWSARDARVDLVLLAAPATAGAARNAGRAFAAGLPRAAADEAALLLFIDADCRLEAGGAARLADELLRSGASAMSARVLARGGAVARARHILEFKEAASRRPPPRAWLPPSTTMLCRCDAFDRSGGFPDLWPGEDLVFAQSLRDRGERVLRSRRVTTVHAHPPGVLEMLRHQRRLGRTAAQARRTRPMPGSMFAKSPWVAVLLLPGRMVRIAAWQAREGRRALAEAAWLSPLLLAGLVAWTAGFVAGAAAKAGPAGAQGGAAGRENPAAMRRAEAGT